MRHYSANNFIKRTAEFSPVERFEKPKKNRKNEASVDRFSDINPVLFFLAAYAAMSGSFFVGYEIVRLFL